MNAAAGTKTLGRNRRCRGCAYELEGLASSGRCPECGRWYPPFEGEEYDLAAWYIVRRLVWPIPFVLLTVPFVALMRTDAPAAVRVASLAGAAALALVCLANGPLQVYALLRWNREQGRRAWGLMRPLPFWGKVEVMVGMIIAAVPWVILVLAVREWM